jgi:hypothetical protein
MTSWPFSAEADRRDSGQTPDQSPGKVQFVWPAKKGSFSKKIWIVSGREYVRNEEKKQREQFQKENENFKKEFLKQKGKLPIRSVSFTRTMKIGDGRSTRSCERKEMSLKLT